ncbi:5745_t:CDS:2 [Entrophospora sp. SA101]|nr:5745_t:CDS:2 [Entrophospora sp. SA101]
MQNGSRFNVIETSVKQSSVFASPQAVLLENGNVTMRLHLREFTSTLGSNVNYPPGPVSHLRVNRVVGIVTNKPEYFKQPNL